MFRKTFLAGALACFSGTCVFADFTYEQTTKITGGVMAGAMKLAGVFSKQAREPIVSSVVVKGDKMAHINPHHISIIDLGSETITDVNLDKKQYSVMTFAEMKEALQRMAEKASKSKAESKDPNADMNFKVSVNNTGQTKVVNGFNAKEMIMTLALEGTDKKTGETGALTMTNDMWIAPKVAGYAEVQDFHRRMAQKLAWTPGAFGMGAMMSQPAMIKGMAEAAKEMSKIDGIPVLTIMKMGGTGTGAPGDQSMAANQQQQQQAQQQKPDVAGAAGSSAGSAVGRKLGGGLGGLAGGALGGGFGGFGRKKKNQEEQAQQQEQPPVKQASAQQPPSGDASGALMEATTEITTFSSAPVDPGKFQVPAGFKKVESDMDRAMRQ